MLAARASSFFDEYQAECRAAGMRHARTDFGYVKLR
jgi:hypothetical protein